MLNTNTMEDKSPYFDGLKDKLSAHFQITKFESNQQTRTANIWLEKDVCLQVYYPYAFPTHPLKVCIIYCQETFPLKLNEASEGRSIDSYVPLVEKWLSTRQPNERKSLSEVNELNHYYVNSLHLMAQKELRKVTESKLVWAQLRLFMQLSEDIEHIRIILHIYELLLGEQHAKEKIMQDKEITNAITKLSIEENEAGRIAKRIVAQLYSGDIASMKLAIEKELCSIIGLEPVKEEIRALLNKSILDKKREQQGHIIEERTMYHMCFTGNPGVGKTSVARLMGKLFHRLGILSKGHVVEVQRGDLVGEYVGQTAPKTRKKIEEANGGILFIDEAYRLCVPGSTNDYGKEAIEEVMKELQEARDIIFIFAGYPMEMKAFLQSNLGLPRRVPLQFNFPDYTEHELAQILLKMVHKKNLKVERSLDVDKIERIISQNTTKIQRTRDNAGLVDNLIEAAKRHLDSRLDPLLANGDALITITEDDLMYAVRR